MQGDRVAFDLQIDRDHGPLCVDCMWERNGGKRFISSDYFCPAKSIRKQLRPLGHVELEAKDLGTVGRAEQIEYLDPRPDGRNQAIGIDGLTKRVRVEDILVAQR